MVKAEPVSVTYCLPASSGSAEAIVLANQQLAEIVGKEGKKMGIDAIFFIFASTGLPLHA